MRKPKSHGCCTICGADIVLSRRRSFCSPECAKQGHRQRNDMHKNECLQVKIKVEPRPKREYKSPISDAEQHRLNRSLDAKHDAPMESRRYLPGDPGFAELAEYYTKKYHPEYRGPRTITADFDPGKYYGRRENVKELR